ncbi:polyprenyl synthetase family protein [Sporolituus thermophilus]|uniref:Heptaprenyl diphosphate synthase n=1 Tax=Sporolituus thermophilus DSM 23256 TaxID=1123285 RepID=A0A1G7J622_9FIRM|nr:polyprenyl synthetase family protein [Sporolituus thermophilus]SDF19949.1 heptaprenyl diphosphate synthase [Sporolituus thermophilus DSM 23256]
MTKPTMFALVEADLRAVEQALAEIIHSPVDQLTQVGRHLLQAGGKRLRPALYLLCAKSRQGETRALVPVAVAIEMIHMATLVHDDVIDNAATRRGLPTANSRWGNHVSVLSGDFLFAKAFSTVARHATPAMLRILTDVVCSMCEGEILQIRDTFSVEQSEEDYLVRIAKKTADFIAASCELGGLSAGLAPDEVAALRRYGHAVGMAFQITDDILDITATSAQLGKPAGNDLRQGILTLPVLYALQHSPCREELRRLVISRDLDELGLERGLTIVRDSGGIEYAYEHVSRYLKEARLALPADLDGIVRQTLLAIADFVGLRKY